MKALLQTYTFNAAAKTIKFITTDTISLDEVLLITNVTKNIIIYNFANPALGGTISNNTLTLTYNTAAGMSNTDVLQIYLDNAQNPSSEESVQYLKQIVQLLTPLATQDSQQRQRVTIDGNNTSTTALWVQQTSAPSLQVTANQATATNLQATVNAATLASVDSRYLFIDTARNTYANGIRRNITN